jgi:hypothetical protein
MTRVQKAIDPPVFSVPENIVAQLVQFPPTLAPVGEWQAGCFAV